MHNLAFTYAVLAGGSMAAHLHAQVELRRRMARILLLLVAMALPAGRDAWAQPRIVLEPVVGGLESPLYVTHARDGSGRLFIVERAGRIRILRPGAVEPTVFLDLSPRVLIGGEQGLLGLAFHPAYPANGRLFVNYTRRPDGATVIAEYRVSPGDPDRAGAAETVVLVVPQPFENHNGGMIEFGPDGLLYIGLGDGGSSNDPGARAQNIDELLGKFLRIDVDHPAVGLAYSSPPTNPFAGSVPGRDEIFAVGFRNPWRFSFDRATGALYAGDVGQDAIEEIDVVTLGGNFGWRVFEGTRCTGNDPSRCAAPGFTPPIAEYAHAGGRCSITGGHVYRGRRGTLPSGAYVFGDFCSGEIVMLRDGAQSVLLPSGLSIASFGEDGAGELYVVDLGGTVYRIVSPEAIRLGLTLNRSIARPGEILTVDVTEENPGGAQVVDQYLGALLPPETGPAAGCPANDPVAFVSEGGAAVIVTCLSTPPFPAFARGVVVPATAPATTRRVFTLPWSATSPAGAYLAFVAYAPPGAAPAPDVIAIAAAAFTASP